MKKCFCLLVCLTGVLVCSLSPAQAASWKWIAYGDTRTNDAAHRSVLTAIQAYTPDYQFLFNVGDLTDDGSVAAYWDIWQKACTDILGSTTTAQTRVPPTYIGVSGNHDAANGGGAANWSQYLAGQYRQFGNGGKFFTFDYQNARFVVLDTEESATSAQLTLLNNAIQANSQDWLFVIWHKPIFSFGTKAYDEGGVAPAWDLPLYQNGCDIIFNGHAHYYARTLKLGLNGQPHPPLDATKGVAQIITGDGGAPPYTVDASYQGNSYMAAATFSGGYGYTELTVDGRTLTLRHILADGHVQDSVTYAANPKPGWPGTGSPTSSPTTTLGATMTPAPTATRTPPQNGATATLTSTPTSSRQRAATPTPTVPSAGLGAGEGTPTIPGLAVKVYPQPGRDQVRLAYHFQGPGRVVAELYNLAGERSLRLEERPADEGDTAVTVVQTSALSPGVYFLHLTVEDGLGRRLLKSRIVIRR